MAQNMFILAYERCDRPQIVTHQVLEESIVIGGKIAMALLYALVVFCFDARPAARLWVQLELSFLVAGGVISIIRTFEVGHSYILSFTPAMTLILLNIAFCPSSLPSGFSKLHVHVSNYA